MIVFKIRSLNKIVPYYHLIPSSQEILWANPHCTSLWRHFRVLASTSGSAVNNTLEPQLNRRRGCTKLFVGAASNYLYEIFLLRYFTFKARQLTCNIFKIFSKFFVSWGVSLWDLFFFCSCPSSAGPSLPPTKPKIIKIWIFSGKSIFYEKKEVTFIVVRQKNGTNVSFLVGH